MRCFRFSGFSARFEETASNLLRRVKNGWRDYPERCRPHTAEKPPNTTNLGTTVRPVSCKLKVALILRTSVAKVSRKCHASRKMANSSAQGARSAHSGAGANEWCVNDTQLSEVIDGLLDGGGGGPAELASQDEVDNFANDQTAGRLSAQQQSSQASRRSWGTRGRSHRRTSCIRA